jgi:hypothetical protein
MSVPLASGERQTYQLEFSADATDGWVLVQEKLTDSRSSPAVTVSGSTECVAGNELRTVAREAAYPMRNPWFEGDVSELGGDMLEVVNSSAQAGTAWLCYSAGSLYSVPDGRRPGELMPVCSVSFAVQLAPFSARQFPVQRNGSSYFAVRSQGAAIVLQMLKPHGGQIRIYSVDSSIRFGS